ncbi:hypothetical protein CDCA_CDCA03G0891 [Cyanidium caldarium]|uniref:Uncharacterized protein n=1 Tax=Cyanidium caldarium TaxID=2771 RepID=A0AAV9IS17_CYACA|nr:hypothetical protein CDCA_CDCA03G0891 [Cyanidium caldarium]
MPAASRRTRSSALATRPDEAESSPRSGGRRAVDAPEGGSRPPKSAKKRGYSAAATEDPAAASASATDRPRRKKGCFINLKDYDDPQQVAKFEAISHQLNATSPQELGFRPGDAVDVSPRALSQLTAQLLLFQERVLGRDSTEAPELRSRLTKLPWRLFRDYSGDGPLRTILETCFRYKAQHGIRRFDWHKPEHTGVYVDMLVEAQRALVQRGQLHFARFYLAKSIPAQQASRLRNTAERHGAQVVSSVAQATHVVYPDPPGTTEAETAHEDYCVSLRRKGNQVLTHWWYFPDSYDSWIPAQEVDDPDAAMGGDSDSPSGVVEGKVWHVQQRFIEDVDKFNEWGNENDYDTIPDEQKIEVSAAPSPAPAAPEATARGGAKREAAAADRHPGSTQPYPSTTAASGAGNSAEPVKIKLRLGGELDSGAQATPAAAPSPPAPAPPASPAPTAATNGPRSIRLVGLKRTATPAQTASTDEAPAENRLAASALRPNVLPPYHDDATLRLRNISGTSRDEEAQRKRAEEEEEARRKRKERHDAAAAEEDALPGPRERAARDRESLAPAAVAEALGGIGSVPFGPDAAAMAALPETAPVRIPSHSRWFNIHHIHDIERRALPEFFSGKHASKTPETYRMYRNFMIDTWRRDPSRYLTATAARRHLAGDVCAILRVHAFLEHWGLINYGVENDTRPPASGGPPSAMLMAGGAADGAARAAGIEAGMPRILLFDDGSAVPKSRRALAPTVTRRELFAAAAAVEYTCDVCGGDCSALRYHCVQRADMDLCPTCHANGRYPAELRAEDFVELRPVLSLGDGAATADEWSDAEVLQLLEGIELHGDNWDAVAEHVGTKGKDACVTKFLRLPIEDPFLEDDLARLAVPGVRQAARAKGPESITAAAAELPFADAANPVMAQVAFLTSTVSPDVAAAAARAALQKLVPADGDGAVADQEAVQAAAATALAAAATRAGALAAAEDVEMRRATEALLHAQLNKLEAKMHALEALDTSVEQERGRLERYRKELFAERLNLVARRELLQASGDVQAPVLAPVADEKREEGKMEG